jgi:hypothetical protein
MVIGEPMAMTAEAVRVDDGSRSDAASQCIRAVAAIPVVLVRFAGLLTFWQKKWRPRAPLAKRHAGGEADRRSAGSAVPKGASGGEPANRLARLGRAATSGARAV